MRGFLVELGFEVRPIEHNRKGFSLFDEILCYVHPLRHPARFRALYERVRSRFADIEPVIRWGGSS